MHSPQMIQYPSCISKLIRTFTLQESNFPSKLSGSLTELNHYRHHPRLATPITPASGFFNPPNDFFRNKEGDISTIRKPRNSSTNISVPFLTTSTHSVTSTPPPLIAMTSHKRVTSRDSIHERLFEQRNWVLFRLTLSTAPFSISGQEKQLLRC